MPDDEASLEMARLKVSGSEMVATFNDPPGWPTAYSKLEAFRRSWAMRSQSSNSVLRRDCSPSGPRIQVRCPSLNPVQLSALRQTISPPVVRWCASPTIGLKLSFSKHSPTTSGPSASSISDLRVANPRTNSQSWVALTGAASATKRPTTNSAINLFRMTPLPVRAR